MSSTIDKTLSKLGLSGGAIRTYGVLLEQKEANAKRLGECANLPRTSIYGYLNELMQMGLVVEFNINNKKVFKLDDPHNIEVLLQKKASELNRELKDFKKILPDFKKGLGSNEPRIKFYPGKESFVVVLADLIRSGTKEALFLWPFEHMTELIGEEQLQDFTKRRVTKGISIRSIYPRSNYANLKFPMEHIRLAPAVVNWNMGSIIYRDKVAFISSREEQFAFIVQSRDFAELQKVQFENLWRVSKRAKA